MSTASVHTSYHYDQMLISEMAKSIWDFGREKKEENFLCIANVSET